MTPPILNRFAPYLTFLLSNFLFDKIKNGSGRHIESHIYGRNSVNFARKFAPKPTQMKVLSHVFSGKSEII